MSRTLVALLSVAVSIGAFAAERQVRGKHLTVVLDQSREQLPAGGSAVLTAKVQLPPDFHVYAPGVEAPYRPIVLRLDPVAGVKTAVHFPPGKPLRLEAIGETVPAYAGEFLIKIDVKAVANAPRDLEVRGTLDYQTCDDKICYIPASVPVSWRLQVVPATGKTPPQQKR